MSVSTYINITYLCEKCMSKTQMGFRALFRKMSVVPNIFNSLLVCKVRPLMSHGGQSPVAFSVWANYREHSFPFIWAFISRQKCIVSKRGAILTEGVGSN